MGMIVSQLGQKPKLGGRYAYTDRSLISIFASCQFSVYSYFAFLIYFCFCCLFSQNPKYQKYFCCFSFALFSLMRVVVLFRAVVLFCLFDFRVAIQKSKNIFLFLFASSLLCFKIENTKNICCSSWFCIVLF